MDYHAVFTKANLQIESTYRPLAKENEPYPWVNETRIPPWVIYVLKHQDDSPGLNQKEDKKLLDWMRPPV